MPDPSGTSYVTEFAFLVREGTEMRAVHDRHVEGLFDTATWERVLSEADFIPEKLTRPLDEEERDGGYTQKIFLGRRPE